MQPSGGMQSWEGTLVTAPGDGIGPAVLLTLGHRLKGQYLFNVPEGFSRLVLEHRVRPTAGLRAAFATDLPALVGGALRAGANCVLACWRRQGGGVLASDVRCVLSLMPQAGFGGLVMRLRNEGHGQLHVVGPPGASLATQACPERLAMKPATPPKPAYILFYFTPQPARNSAASTV